MPETPEYERGPALIGEQPLQQGEAKQLNEAVDMIPSAADPPEGVDLTGAESIKPDKFTPSDDIRDVMLGPSAVPSTHVGQTPPERRPKPKDMEKWLPDLLAAAEDPSAPEELHMLLRMLAADVEDF